MNVCDKAGRLTICAMYLQGKANIEMTTSKYRTPLLVAVDNGQTPVIELLVNKGNKQQFDLLLSIAFHS